MDHTPPRVNGQRVNGQRAAALVVINDLLVYGSVIARPTGIQRVASGVAHALSSDFAAETVLLRGGRAFCAELPDAGSTGVLARINEPMLAALSHAPRRVQEAIRSVARSVVARLSRSGGGAPRPVFPGDWLIMLGAPWIAPGVAGEMVRMKEEGGAKIALLVHDLLPTTSPQWFGDAQGRMAKADMDLLIQHAAVIFAVSSEVVEDIRLRYGRSAIPLPPADPALTNASTGTLDPGEPTSGPIILTVGTLHPRKNLAALVQIWDEWASSAESGGVPPAPLVVVGRRHPQEAGFFETLRQHPRAARWISVRHEVGDEELATLYRRARFLVLPSLAEGWGMPIREALVAGRPSIATDAVPAALHSPYCDVVAAGDTAALGAAIHSWWGGDEPERRAAKIAAEFTPRSWATVAGELAEPLQLIGERQP
jgi:glycosyltransferase involved in cell wall biosynthesis